jgi:hypothetical protein
MKRKNNLMFSLTCFENLHLAFYNAKKGKGTKQSVIDYAANLIENLGLLRWQIINNQADIGNYHYFKIFDPKERNICAAEFRERVLHHAIINICHPFFEKFQIYDSYASRPGKGVYKALQRASEFQKKYRYCCKFDIRKFFDSIDHAILLAGLQRLFKDTGLISIFKQIIDSYQVNPGKGVPIGNLTSQYFANHYLAFLDHFIKDQVGIKGYVRYMDDFVLWHDDKKMLKETANNVIRFLDEHLQLKLKTATLLHTNSGLSFLGYRVFQEKLYLTQRSKQRFINKLTRYEQYLENETWSQAEFQHHATALFSFVNHADSFYFRRKVLSYSGQ